MLKKALMLVGLVAVLAVVGGSASWTAQGAQGVTLDPGVTSDTAARDALIAEALPAIIRAGYDIKQFDFEKAVTDPTGKAIFVPVKLMPKPEALPALIGLLYVQETIRLESHIVQRGYTQCATFKPALVIKQDLLTGPGESCLTKSVTGIGRSVWALILSMQVSNAQVPLLVVHLQSQLHQNRLHVHLKGLNALVVVALLTREGSGHESVVTGIPSDEELCEKFRAPRH
jgi:hypothetical protein